MTQCLPDVASRNVVSTVTRPQLLWPGLALLSYCCNTGVGYAGFDFYSHLPFSRWIVVPHRKLGINARLLDSNCHVLSQTPEQDVISPQKFLRDSLDGISTLVCIERGYYPGLFRLAYAMGIRIILMPNAELFIPDDPELKFVDQFIAPTIACCDMLNSCGFGSRTEYIPHAIDTNRFAFRVRTQFETALHCHGWGGYKGRKGTDIVAQSADFCPNIPFIIRCQKPLTNYHANIHVHPATVDREQLYVTGDICIQPSRWEGVGLQILEAMACGLPTLVPDAPPMNEYPVEKSLCIPATSSPVKIHEKQWVQWEMDPHTLAATLRALHHQSVEELSTKTRSFIESRSWVALKSVYEKVFEPS